MNLLQNLMKPDILFLVDHEQLEMDITRAALLDLKKTLSRLLNKSKNTLLYFVVMDLHTIVVKIVVK